MGEETDCVVEKAVEGLLAKVVPERHSVLESMFALTKASSVESRGNPTQQIKCEKEEDIKTNNSKTFAYTLTMIQDLPASATSLTPHSPDSYTPIKLAWKQTRRA